MRSEHMPDRLRTCQGMNQSDIILFAFSMVDKRSLENIKTKWVVKTQYGDKEATKILVGTFKTNFLIFHSISQI